MPALWIPGFLAFMACVPLGLCPPGVVFHVCPPRMHQLAHAGCLPSTFRYSQLTLGDRAGSEGTQVGQDFFLEPAILLLDGAGKFLELAFALR